MTIHLKMIHHSGSANKHSIQLSLKLETHQFIFKVNVLFLIALY